MPLKLNTVVDCKDNGRHFLQFLMCYLLCYSLYVSPVTSWNVPR